MKRPLRQYFPDYLYLLSISGAVILLDQFTKGLVRANLQFTDVWSPLPDLMRYVRIVHWKNTGAAFGIFQNGSLVFTILGILVTLAILNFYPLIPRQDRWLRLALALQLGGAVGNLIDRLAQGYVTDFISVLRFPVFNVADASISAGVVLILVPFLPHVFEDLEASRLRRVSQALNLRRRRTPSAVTKTDEPYSLGLVEVLFAETEFMQAFSLRQDVRRIRLRRNGERRGFSRG